MVVGMRAEEVAITFSAQSYTNAQTVTELNFGEGFTAIFDKGTNKNYAPTYYNTGSALRLYGGNTMKITAPQNATIISVVLETRSGSYVVNSESEVSNGTLGINDTGTTATISNINSQSVTFTQGGSSGHVRIVTLTVNYSIDENVVALPDKPEFEPSSCSFLETQEVTISCSSEDATVYYTTDDSEFTTENWTKYENAFKISETTTVKAIAIRGDNRSEIVSATYTKVSEEDYINVSFSINGEVDVNTNVKILKEEGELQESSLPMISLPNGISLKGWSKDKNSTDVETFPITNITDDITLYAVFVRPTSFRLVTDVAELTAGDRVIIACPKYNKAISTDEMIINDNACAVSTLVTIEDNIIIPTEVTRVFTLGKNGEYFTFEENGAYLACPEDDNRLTMRDSKDSWTITINEEGVAVINNKEYTKRSIQYYSQNPRFACYESVQKSIAIYKEATSEVLSTTYTPITISSIGYATMYLADAVAMPAGVEAYIATGVNGDYLQMEQVMGTLPAETGVILKAAEGEYAFIHSTEEAVDVSDNLLTGTLTNEYIDGAGYVLSAPGDKVGLYAAGLTDGKFLNNANKAYLPASAVASNAPMFSFSRGGDEEDTTGIEYSSPLNSMPSTAIYDLTGRRVEKMEKGIYIVNGKKVIR